MEDILALLRDPALQQALWLTARVSAATLALHALAGLGLGYALARPGWPGRSLLDAVVTLPLVFPPVATGFLLLMLLGRRSLLGRWIEAQLGIDMVFSFAAVVFAAFLAGLPLVVKPVQSAIESVATRLAEAARTLGKNEGEIFLFVILPNIRRALVVGLVLGLGRSLGEVGITLMLGGNIQGRTATVSLEIFNAVTAGDFGRAALLSALLGLLTLGVFFGLRRLGAL